MTETRIVTNGTVKLSVTTRGDAAKPAVVLLHGYPDDSTVWDKVAEDLAADHFVVTYDMRGAGASDAPRKVADYRFDQLMGDLAAVLDAVVPGRKVHLAGHDWGSIQGWAATMDERTRDRLLSYTTMSGPSLDLVGLWMRDGIRSGRLRRIGNVLRQAFSSWYVYLFHAPWLAAPIWRAGMARAWPRLLRRTEGITVEARPGQLNDSLNGMKLYRANFRDRLRRPRRQTVHTPVQLLVPVKDRFVTPALFEGLTEFVPNLTRQDIALGHWVPLTRPDLLAGRIRDMVRSVETGSDSAVIRRGRRKAAAIDHQGRRFAGQQVLITGAGSGIGRATAFAFAKEGADIIAVDIDEAAAERTAMLARLLGATAAARRADVGDAAAMEELAAWTDTHCGPVDIVVNNAGIGMGGGFLQTTVGDWQRILGVNLWGVIHGARLFGQRMVDRAIPGHIVNVASAAAFVPSRTMSAYATTKAAVLMMTNCLRAEMAGQGVNVSAICPGFVETGIAEATLYVGVNQAEETRRRLKAAQMYARRGFTPEQVADAILNTVSSRRPVALVGAEAVIGSTLSRVAPGLLRQLARIDLTPK